MPTTDPTTVRLIQDGRFTTADRPLHPATRAIVLVVAAAALVFFVTACGSSSGDSPTTDAGAPTSSIAVADAATNGGTVPATAKVLTVTADDYAFKGLPKTVPAGTRLTLSNDSHHELHELVAIRLADDETRPVDALMHLPQAELEAIIGAGPPAAVLVAPHGKPEIPAVGDGTLSRPGRYLVFCSIPTGADPAAYLAAAAKAHGGPPQVAGGPPHFVKGMYAELIVS